MIASLRTGLPPVYGSLLPPFFDAAPPAEKKATCSNCAMCPPPGPQPPGVQYFRPDAKCCTYHPSLPNYLVGALLGDEHQALLARVADAYRRATAPTLPARLVLSTKLKMQPVEGGAITTGYSSYEPMFLSAPLLEVLGVLRADEPLAAARVRLWREHEIELPDALLLSLHQARILVEP